MRPAPAIALVTARAARGLDEDMRPLLEALQEGGAECRKLTGTIPRSIGVHSISRSCARHGMPRSACRNSCVGAERVDRLTRLLNPVPVIQWNTDKHYLEVLAEAGVPTVPTAFIEPGEDAGRGVADFL